MVFQLGCQHSLDCIDQHRLQLQPPIRRDVPTCHQPQHLDCRQRHLAHSRHCAAIAEEASRSCAERPRLRRQRLFARRAHCQLRRITQEVKRGHHEIRRRTPRVCLPRQLVKRHHRQLVHAIHRVPVLAHPLRQLRDEGRVRHHLDVARDPQPRQPLHLRHHVKISPPLRQQQVDVPVKLERWPELALLAAHSLRDRPDLAVLARQEREDAIGLAVVELSQHDSPLAVCGQASPPRLARRRRPDPCARVSSGRRRPESLPSTARRP